MNERKIGRTSVVESTVTDAMLADAVGSGSLPVLATPAVCALVEKAAAALAQESLPEGITTVGTALTLEHLRATAPGAPVRAEADLTGQDGRRFCFAVRAYDNAGLIARGTHERASVKAAGFLQKAQARAALPAPPYRAVLFDLDGTLTESHPGVISTVTEALVEMGFPVPEESVLKKFVGPPLQYSFAKYCGMLPDQCEEAVEIFRRSYPKRGAFENSVFPGMRELLEELQARGVKTMVATSKAESAARIILDHFGLSPVVDCLAGAREDQGRQPKSELILRALEDCGVAPQDAVMVGDTHFDADGAQGAGTAFLGVLFGYGTREEMEASGGRVFASSVKELRALLLG